jgi:hypothetical protein
MEVLLQRWSTAAPHLLATRVVWQALASAAASKLLTKCEAGWYSSLAGRLLQHVIGTLERLYSVYEESTRQVGWLAAWWLGAGWLAWGRGGRWNVRCAALGRLGQLGRLRWGGWGGWGRW